MLLVLEIWPYHENSIWRSPFVYWNITTHVRTSGCASVCVTLWVVPFSSYVTPYIIYIYSFIYMYIHFRWHKVNLSFNKVNHGVSFATAFYQTRSAWSVGQGSTDNHSPVNNCAPTVTKFCVMWEGQALPHDTKFGNCRDKVVDSRAFPSWSLIHGSSWSGLIKVEPHLFGTNTQWTPRVAMVPTMVPWWRHQMEKFSALLALCQGSHGSPSQRPVTRRFDVFFDLCLNKRLSKQSTRRWF